VPAHAAKDLTILHSRNLAVASLNRTLSPQSLPASGKKTNGSEGQICVQCRIDYVGASTPRVHTELGVYGANMYYTHHGYQVLALHMHGSVAHVKKAPGTGRVHDTETAIWPPTDEEAE
jgi:hypothetical protein